MVWTFADSGRIGAAGQEEKKTSEKIYGCGVVAVKISKASGRKRKKIRSQ